MYMMTTGIYCCFAKPFSHFAIVVAFGKADLKMEISKFVAFDLASNILSMSLSSNSEWWISQKVLIFVKDFPIFSVNCTSPSNFLPASLENTQDHRGHTKIGTLEMSRSHVIPV